MKHLLLVSALVFTAFTAHSATLEETLKLPDYLKKLYGDLNVKVQEGGSTSEAVLTYKTRITNSGAHGSGGQGQSVDREAAGLTFKIPAGLDAQQKKEALSKALFAHLAKEDRQFRFALEDLDAMRVWDPAKGEHSLNLLDRVESVFIAKLSGVEISAKDDVAQTWWKLKFEAEDTLNHQGKIKKGDPVLMILHQKGFFKKSGNFITDLRRKLDLGHSALGIRYAGEGPEKDILLNPGSKTREFYETALPNSAEPNTPNMVDTDNLWKWSETQISKRFMDVNAEILPLTKTQKEALPVLIPRVRGVNLGPAVALTNNCADGAGALVNFLMPIERTFSAKSVLGPALPTKVSGRANDRFQGAQAYKFPSLSGDKQVGDTPDISYKDQSFKREELTTFDKYLDFEKQMLSSQ